MSKKARKYRSYIRSSTRNHVRIKRPLRHKVGKRNERNFARWALQGKYNPFHDLFCNLKLFARSRYRSRGVIDMGIRYKKSFA